MRKFVTDMNEKKGSVPGVWRYWRGFLFLVAVMVFYGVLFAMRSSVGDFMKSVFLSMFLMNAASLGIRAALKEKSWYLWPVVAFGLVFFCYFAADTSDWIGIIYVVLAAPVIMLMVVKPMELFFFPLCILLSWFFGRFAGEHFPPYILAQFATIAIWFVYKSRESKGRLETVSGSSTYPASPVETAATPTLSSSGVHSEDMTVLMMSAFLLVESGPRAGEKFTLRAGTTCLIGRGEQCHLRIKAPSVSRVHGRIEALRNVFRYTDEASSNGSFVNEKEVSTHDLAEGDVLSIGESRIRFTMRS